MGNFSLHQRQQSGRSTAPTSFFLRSRSSASVSTPFSQPVPDDAQTRDEHARHPGHSLARIAVFSPEKENHTGLPDPLKAGIERLSGISIGDVKVHYHSSKPVQVQAWAYTQGTDIYAETGQEKYLPHEAWHAVQQKQGRVQPTLRVRGRAVNDDQYLEQEADVMGAKAMQVGESSLTKKADQNSSFARLSLFPGQQIPSSPIKMQWQSGIAPIQRGIRKPGGKGETYLKAPPTYGGENFSKTLRQELQKIIDNDEKNANGDDFTLRQAIALAKGRVQAFGRFKTGRAGKRLRDTKDLLAYLKKRGADTTTTEDKFTRMDPIYNATLQTVEVMEEDFKAMPISTNPATAHQNFVSTFNEVVPTLTRTVSAFNEVAEAQVKQGGGLASSLKGSQFEHWARQNVLTHANKRITVKKKGKMSQDRTSDAYDAAKQTLWDIKHYLDTNVPKDQAEDYYEIVINGYTSTNGDVVSQVNYLFPTLDGAQQNEWLSTSYGFGVYYVDKDKLKQLA